MTLRILLLVGWAFNSAVTAQAALTNAAPAAAGPPAVVPPANPYPDAIPSTEIIGRAETILAQYPAPAVTSTPDSVQLAVEQGLGEKEPAWRIFSEELSVVLSKNPPLDRIRFLENLARYFANSPQDWTGAITARTTDLAKKITEISGDKAVWTETRDAVASSKAPVTPGITQRIQDVLKRLDAVGKSLLVKQTALLNLEDRVTQQNTQITEALNQLSLARERAINELFERNVPPVWQAADATIPSAAHGPTWSTQVKSLSTYAQANSVKFVIHGVLLGLLTAFFYWLRGYGRKWTEKEPGIRTASTIFEIPVATAGLLSLIASPILYYPIAPRLLSAILSALALVPSVILLRRLIEPRLFPILNALVIFFFLEEFRSVVAFSPGYGRALFLGEVLAGIAFLTWLLLSLRRSHATTPARRFGAAVSFGLKAALVTLSVAWAANVLGYVLLANLLCEVVQRGSTLALALYAGIRIVTAILFIMSRLRPLSTLAMVEQHGTLLLDRIGRALAWLAVVFWILYVLDLLSLRTPLESRVGGFLSTYDSGHHLTLTLTGKILLAAFIGWGAFKLSIFARFVLQTDFFPRLHLSAGIPYAISTSLHYATLVVAFVGATYVLGIDMTKFTILVSALGVGVGFGLQNIINNFVSGLILLFERPVKIGDSIQSGDAIGVVERIGIRASVLRTTTGSEMIVPNGNLISSSVTNWTWSSQERIIIIPFNIVRGPDVAHVIELLTETVGAHPKLLKEPPPQVLVMTLGANLGFELRCWTREIEDWSVIRSELMLAINSTLTRENITLA